MRPTDWGGSSATVVRGEHESFEALLGRFRRQVQRSGVLGEAKRRQHYVSDSEKAAVKRQKAIERQRRMAGGRQRNG